MRLLEYHGNLIHTRIAGWDIIRIIKAREILWIVKGVGMEMFNCISTITVSWPT